MDIELLADIWLIRMIDNNIPWYWDGDCWELRIEDAKVYDLSGVLRERDNLWRRFKEEKSMVINAFKPNFLG